MAVWLTVVVALTVLVHGPRRLAVAEASGGEVPQWYHAAYLRERGVPELRRRFEQVRSNGSSQCAVARQADQPVDPRRCVTPDLFALPFTPRTLEQWLDPLPVVQDPALQQEYYPGHPFLDGQAFYKMCDYTWSTYYPFFRGRVFNDTFNVSAVANRSLVFWSLNYKGPDLSHLLHRIDAIPNHFFLMTHKQDHIRIPPWLLDHPKVLKVFAVNVPYPLEHPKLVALPLGIGEHGRQPSRAINDFLRNASHRAPQKLLHIGHYQMKVGSVQRAMRRRHVLNNVRRSFAIPRAAGRRLPKAEFYAAIREYRFALSPPGDGWDAFRTWEVLYLGRVPVVSLKLPPVLYAALPVHLVGNWSLFDAAQLNASWAALRRRTFNAARLYIDWWLTFILRTCLETP
eukprot:EG_transcript_13297